MAGRVAAALQERIVELDGSSSQVFLSRSVGSLR
jgi:hypothetical protein